MQRPAAERHDAIVERIERAELRHRRGDVGRLADPEAIDVVLERRQRLRSGRRVDHWCISGNTGRCPPPAVLRTHAVRLVAVTVPAGFVILVSTTPAVVVSSVLMIGAAFQPGGNHVWPSPWIGLGLVAPPSSAPVVPRGSW